MEIVAFNIVEGGCPPEEQEGEESQEQGQDKGSSVAHGAANEPAARREMGAAAKSGRQISAAT
ncbi:MAG: hypothetical protein ACYC99_08390 [Candidatus Geothermincolia bacterium]